uniref:ribonuclease P n=1 Tax=Oryza meridionalis TaxID=40149 RepID=A0A0E0CJ15_9ORYZ
MQHRTLSCSLLTFVKTSPAALPLRWQRAMAMAPLFAAPPHLLLLPATTSSSPAASLRRLLPPPLSCHARQVLDVMPQGDRVAGPRAAEGAGAKGATAQVGVATREAGTAGRHGRGRHGGGARPWRRGEERPARGEQHAADDGEVQGTRRGGDLKQRREGRRWTRGETQARESGKAGNSGRGQSNKASGGNASRKGKKKAKGGENEVKLRVELDMCSKRGDVMGAINLYDSAVKEGIKMGQHHYSVLLYLCSSAALGFVQPAKSGNAGSGIASIGQLHSSSTQSVGNLEGDDVQSEGHSEIQEGNTTDLFASDDGTEKPSRIPVSDELREYARTRGFEIFEKMRSEEEKVPMNESALTAVARMAMSMGNGDMAFDVVKQMKDQGIAPKLRSYGPALTAFCNSGNVEKAFEVEAHMLESGVRPEEPELETLLRASVVAQQGDRIYYLLHKFRTTVSPSTAKLLESWFRCPTASKVGKRKWDAGSITKAIENNGGGWHGLGWLGRGKWTISHSHIDRNGVCLACGEKLTIIDLDPKETEDFATLVAKLAIKRERRSNFENFQRWLEKHGPFDAVVDGANINIVADVIRQRFQSRKFPLIVVHNRHLTGERMQKPSNRKLVEKWKQSNALYATPTGSNDDWYWLYAAIRCKCLMVTNDEMRDHTFQLLERDFFPKWKERHQVRFNFEDSCVTLQMPPPCSVVIQESEKGQWHIPVVSEEGSLEKDRTWIKN